MDEYSDLDLIVVVKDEAYNQVLKQRKSIAQRIGFLLDAFTGEHVGESRLLICLYDRPLLHVDLKFVSLKDFAVRVEDPVIIWERDSIVSEQLDTIKAVYPKPDLQWIENRFWIWVHYIAGKIGRGELFDVIESMSFLRSTVFGPLILMKSGAQPQGVRRIELYGPEYIDDLKKTLPDHTKISCLHALKAAIALYRRLLSEPGDEKGSSVNKYLIEKVENYVSDIGRRVIIES
ncbi:MAG: hypothetical protein P8X42_09895 [Calditrichaceae bacterium]